MGIFFCISLVITVSFSFGIVAGDTDSRDVTTLRSIQRQWGNPPGLTWAGVDPCASNWVGVYCHGSRVTDLLLSTMGLKGELPSDIERLTDLQRLDLSYNPDLTGSILPGLGNLANLRELLLIGCSFTGSIPEELGNLQRLTTRDLNSNKLGGNVPASLGNLSNLYWLDVANNNLVGTLPAELGKLVNAGHFHFNKNRLRGSIPPEIFHENMPIQHVLFDQNLFTGTIPSTLGLVKKISVIRLDRNRLEGPIPPNISSLINLGEMHLSNNKLNGRIPDLSGLKNLQYLDLSNNSFDVSLVPDWISSSELLTTVVMENGVLNGPLPSSLLNLPSLETFTLFQNPVCAVGTSLANDKVCDPEMAGNGTVYTTPMKDCGKIVKCEVENMQINPVNCKCAMPLEGVMVLRSPSFSALNNNARFQRLEKSLESNLSLSQGSSVYIICCMSFDANDYLNIKIWIFPPVEKQYFEPLDIIKLGYSLSNQTYKPPKEFGPYYFIPNPYLLFYGHRDKSTKEQQNIGIAIGAALLVLAIIGIGIYAFTLKKKKEAAAKNSRPFGSWGFASSEYSGGAPKLKGARWFTFQELKQATNNFSTSNEIGSGGYGMVYKGILAASGQMVAVKRAKEESMQGGEEFKTEIELLSRVHHKNLVGLVGFCFEGGEHMLVYEYMPNGSLRDNLSGRTGINLDWRKRIRIALGAARGLTYLHDHANPAIIHRDVKTSNILLDQNLNAKVADFGLSKLIADTGGGGHVSTQVKGTMGYLDPEYYMRQQLTHKSDVYSYGVVLLEMLTARQPIERGKYLVREVRTAIEIGGINSQAGLQLLDSALRNSPINPSVLESFVSLALRCCEDYGVNRPKMSEVVKELESMAEKFGANDAEPDIEMESSVVSNPYAEFQLGSFDYSGSGGHIVPPIIEPK
ncbi:leucine-rich repeat receptor protein kinase HPCA1 [Cryptomeria japonica]|uniref:leucine-rich repeat receptor protein kinase HPCA1 n=1 Tax=Cryptomeria japonica TaxID=3369 RepID=UPI0027DA2FBA|nr:leucine-rich repeat receptor protein kinase HPCA1 [Cryptomeria japonica]